MDRKFRIRDGSFGIRERMLRFQGGSWLDRKFRIRNGSFGMRECMLRCPCWPLNQGSGTGCAETGAVQTVAVPRFERMELLDPKVGAQQAGTKKQSRFQK